MNWHQKHVSGQGLGVKFALKFVGAMGTIQFVAAFNIIVIAWVLWNSLAQ